MKHRFTFGQSLHYAVRTLRRDRLRRWIGVVICAAAVAFTALCAGYLEESGAQQTAYLKCISDRQLIVYSDENGIGNYLAGGTPAIDPELVAQFAEIDEVEQVSPVLTFVSDPFYTAGIDAASNLEKYPNVRAQELHAPKQLTLTDANGKTREVNAFYVSLQSFATGNYYDSRSEVVDETAENGGYISRTFADQLGITDETMNGLTLTMEVFAPAAQVDWPICISEETTFGMEMRWIRYYTSYYVKTTISFPVRGIYDPTELLNPYLLADVYLPVERMKEALSRAEEFNRAEAEEALAYLEKMDAPSWEASELPPPEEMEMAYRLSEWAPTAYELEVTDMTVLPEVKRALAALSPNFSFIQEYQDVAAGVEYINNARTTLQYSSYAVLAVVFLLTTLLYAGLIDRRKFEFAVLRANGLTKREVRKTVCAEMLLQFLVVLACGAVFAVLIFLVVGKLLGYPFTLDGMTFAWLALISLGSVLLPTAVSLGFVGRYEPDRVMRD